MTDFVHLAAPLRQGRLDLKNRIVHASILTRFAIGEQATDRLIRYHANRARGGAAMIVTEAVNALPMQAGRGAYLNAYSDEGHQSLFQLAEAVRMHDCRLLAQLQERGRGNYARVAQSQAVGPSALPDDIAGAVPRPLPTDEVERMIEDFAAAARRLERAGFDGVEISAGHGHLFHQFLSGHANRRKDRFGGDQKSRATFLIETIQAVRASVGADFILAVKLPAEDGDPGGVNLDAAAEIARLTLKPGAVDLASFAWGAQNRRLHWHVPDGHFDRAPYVEKIEALREAANGVPVAALGRIVDPNEAEAVLAEGRADLISVGRALIADAAWPRLALAGRGHAIRACVSCNTCWGAIAEPAPLVCDTNPDLATEAETERLDHEFAARPVPAPSLRLGKAALRLVVVGGGVAGLSLAATAAEAGHETTLFHRRPDVGGRAWLAARLPGGEGLQGVYDDDAARACAAGARLELGVEARADDLIALAPDRVAIATGAEIQRPETGALGDADIAPSLDWLLREAFRLQGRLGRHLVIIDREDGIWVYRAAEFLAARFDCVTVLTERETPASREPLVVRQGLLERLAAGRVKCVTMALATPEFDALAEGKLGYCHALSGAPGNLSDVDAIAVAGPRAPRLDLAPPLAAAGYAPILLGDAFQPRALMHTVSDGRRIGRRLMAEASGERPGEARI